MCFALPTCAIIPSGRTLHRADRTTLSQSANASARTSWCRPCRAAISSDLSFWCALLPCGSEHGDVDLGPATGPRGNPTVSPHAEVAVDFRRESQDREA